MEELAACSVGTVLRPGTAVCCSGTAASLKCSLQPRAAGQAAHAGQWAPLGAPGWLSYGLQPRTVGLKYRGCSHRQALRVQSEARTCELGLRFSTSSREALASAMSSASTADCCARGWQATSCTARQGKPAGS